MAVRLSLITFLSALLALIAACVQAAPPTTAPTPQLTPAGVAITPSAGVTYTIALPTVMAGRQSQPVDCTAGDPSQPSPIYSHQVYRATSPDGYTFTTDNRLLIDHASVPDGVIGPDGKQWVYFVNGEPGHHGIFVAREAEAGHFEIVDCVKLDGRFEGNAVDPDIRRLEDGSYRLFYFLGSFVTPPDPNQKTHPIYSAVSTDGINFTIEQKVFEEADITDPSVVKLPGGAWLMAVVHSNETVLARSSDGMAFTRQEPPFSVQGTPELGLMADGSVRLYLTRSFRSTDGGKTWTQEPEHFIPRAGPSLVAVPGDGYVMFYKTFPPPQR